MIPVPPVGWTIGRGPAQVSEIPEIIPAEQVPPFAWFYSILILAGAVTLVLIWKPLQARTNLWERHTRYIARRPFTWGDLGLVLCTLLALYPAGGLLLYLGERTGLDPMTQQVLIQSVTFHWAILAMFVVLLWAKGVSWRRAFGLYPGRAGRDVAMGITGYLAMMPVVLLYGIISWVCLHALGLEQDVQEIARILAADGHPAVRIYKFVLAAAIAPVAEELFFRGLLFTLIARRFGSLSAVIAVSVLFAGIHFHLPGLLPLFIMSTILCMAYVQTCSIRVPIVMHMLFNIVNLTTYILVR